MTKLGKRVVAEFKVGKMCPVCDEAQELIYRLFFDHTWEEFCPKCSYSRPQPDKYHKRFKKLVKQQRSSK